MARCFLHFIKSEHGLKRSIIWYGVAKTAINSKKRLEIPEKSAAPVCRSGGNCAGIPGGWGGIFIFLVRGIKSWALTQGGNRVFNIAERVASLQALRRAFPCLQARCGPKCVIYRMTAVRKEVCICTGGEQESA